MSSPTNPHREQPNTYFVQDRSNQNEMTRLQIQDQMLTAKMRGVLPEQPDLKIFKRVLDIGCGTGGWLIEAAKTYPSMSVLVGVDVNSQMLEYARTQATAQGVGDRVQFQAMDALLMLEVPASYFDLVNQRLGISYLRTWDWPKLLSEYLRVTTPGGVIRITEAEPMTVSTSPALTTLCSLFLQALHQAGHLFTPSPDGLTSKLANMMGRYGLKNVQTRAYPLEYRAGTADGQYFYEDEKNFFRNIVPFLRKWTRVPDDYEIIYQQMLVEMQQPDFVATWNLLTAWGTKLT